MKIPRTAPDPLARLTQLLDGAADPAQVASFLQLSLAASGSVEGYPHWDKLRHLTPPDGFSSEDWWAAIKLQRRQSARTLPLRQLSGEPFTYNLTDEVLQLTDEITRLASGQIAIDERVTNPSVRDRYIVSSLIEEAITSSQLEGAVTTRKVAKEMLRQGRAPRNHSELMIFNNFAAMTRITEVADRSLTPELVRELHRIVVEDALEDPLAAGELQREGQERVSVWSVANNEVVHRPPPAAELPDRLEELCAFANGQVQDGPYLPPLLRAIAVHFMCGYDHYFVDGNGRTARALFYWSMLHEGFWLAEFLTISRILHKAPAQYGRSFLLTETDGGDLTYFFLYHLGVIKRAIDDLRAHLATSIAGLREAQSALQSLPEEFNHRQLALLGHALHHPGFIYTAESHASSHRVSTQTARTDLGGLAAVGLLHQRRRGHRYEWRVPDDFPNRIEPGRAPNTK